MTTGRLAYGHGGPNGLTPCIYRDNGRYEGTIEDYNVRKVSVVATLDCLDGETARTALCGDAEHYGCRWGGGMDVLHIITNEDAIATLQAKSAKARAEAERKEAEAEKQAIQQYKRLRQSGLCPKCGTWCYGDCEEA